MNKIILLIFCFCLSNHLFAQKITKIQLDSLAQLEQLKVILKDLPAIGTVSKRFEINNIITDHIQAITINKEFESLSFSIVGEPQYVAVYLDKVLVFFLDSKWENSRMGSCGDVVIENYYFIENNQISKVYHVESNILCYNDSPMSMMNILNLVK